MADLVTNLYLRTQHFDESIQNVQKQLDALNKTLLDVDKKISKPTKSLFDFSNILSNSTVKSLTKFAGKLGLTMTSIEAFEKLIQSSQTTSDAFDKAMAAVTGTVNQFFTALSTGDFTSMTMGLGSIIDKAVEAQAALDQLGNTMMSYNYFSSKIQAEFGDTITVQRNKRSTQAEKDAANKRMNELIVEQQEANEGYAKAINDVIQKTATKGTLLDASMFDRDVYERTMRLDIKQDQGAKDQLAAEYDEYTAKVNKLQKEFMTTVSVGNGAFVRVPDTDNEEFKAQLKAINKEYLDAVVYNELLVKMSDKELNNFVDLYKNMDAGQRALKSMKDQAVEINNSRMSSTTSKSFTSTTKSVAKDDPAVGSLDYIDKMISEWNKKYRAAADDQARAVAKMFVDELTKQKEFIEKASKVTIPVEVKPLLDTREADKSIQDKLKKDLSTSLTAKIDTGNKQELINMDDDALNYLSSIQSLMNGIAGATDNSAAAWLSYASTMMSSLAAMIPMVATLIGLKAQEGIAEQASHKFPLNLIAMAATATAFVAAIAKVPKFATGGIVSGSSFIGDNVLARVNSGEMILNTSQQKNLFDMLNSSRVSAPMYSGGQIKWKIEGRDLVGVMSNQINKTSKYK